MKLAGHKIPLAPKGISARISTLSWLITVLTIGTFAAAIIPQQKNDLLAALLSKARGVSSSLREVTATAAVSEDYSSVVDQCVQVLAGDEAIAYLVITKNDGFSVVVDRKGWRTETLGESWRPAVREVSSGISLTPQMGMRVYQYDRPFDYSSIQWGWIHVGLSLDGYDQSVKRVYTRTALLALLCVGISLLASITYARRLVQPIFSLQEVVGQVSQGDLTARAQIQSGDEVEGLAKAFNSMTESILQRNRILESVRFAAHQLVTATDWRMVMSDVLSKIGLAAHTTRAFVVEAAPGQDNRPSWRLLSDWRAEGGAAETGDVAPAPWDEALSHNLAARLKAGEVVTQSVGSPARAGRIVIPIHVAEAWFGFVAFEDPTGNGAWSDAKKDSFRALAGMLGAAITRQNAQEALVEAKQTLETRVVDRTRELQEQMRAKERAHAELAEAQQRLIELSRQSGMAEVATGVLHNVGNVLNSVNVSATIVANRVRESRVDNLLALTAMLEEHADDLGTFLKSDARGSRVIPYLAKLGAHFGEERQLVLREIEHLTDHIGHIKGIVAIQQEYAKVSGLTEEVSLPALVDDALHILRPGFERHSIQFTREFEPVPTLIADKHKIIQILLNLLRNAKQAIRDSDDPRRSICVRIRRDAPDRVRLEVQDTGVGLPRENLTRIFAHGFTTKRDGHGFGLHSGSLAAHQMNGSLHAESEGPGKGSTFVLILPLCPESTSQDRRSEA